MTISLDTFIVLDPITIPFLNSEATGEPNSVDWNNINNKPVAFLPSSHTHAQNDVIGLLDEINNLNEDISEIDNDYDYVTNIEPFLTPGL